MNILKFTIKTIALYFSCLIPKNRHLYVFGSWFGEKYADNSKYFFEFLQSKQSERCVWVTKNKAVYDELRSKKYEVEYMNSLRGILLQARAKYIVVSTGFDDVNKSFIGNSIIVNLWHGLPLKKIMYDDIHFVGHTNKVKMITAITRFPFRKEYVVSTSKTISDIYKSAFKKKDKNIIMAGQPRNDVFFNSKDNAFGDRFTNKRIILYMPTHRLKGKQAIDCNKIFDLQELDSFCSEHNCVFLIKKHFYHKDEITDCSKYDSIIDITSENYDTQKMLKACDVLISDYSSVYIDYLLLNKPVIFYNYDYHWYLENDRDMYFQYNDVTPGAKVSSFEDFMLQLEAIFSSNIDEFANDRSKVLEVFYDKQCRQNSCKHLYSIIKEMGS